MEIFSEHPLILKFENRLDEMGQDYFISCIKKYVQSGGRIDSTYDGTTILSEAVERRWMKVVCYALEKGAKKGIGNFIDIIAENVLEMFSHYGLTQLHILSTTNHWDRIQSHIESKASLNQAIDVDCPLWGGMTPILIAAKFKRNEMILNFFKAGASVLSRDAKGSTLLHYMTAYGYYDERFFIYEDENTFDSLTGMSHFHIACHYCPCTLDAVKTYLESGISPDSRVKASEKRLYPEGTTGLHIAVAVQCPELARLLLEYGANIDLRNRSDSTVADEISHLCTYRSLDDCGLKLACLFAETRTNLSHLLLQVSHCRLLTIATTLRCVKKLHMINTELIEKKVISFYESMNNLVKKRRKENFDEEVFAQECLEELRRLDKVGLREPLDDSKDVSKDLKKNVQDYFRTPEVTQSFPIYGSMLQVKLKRRLFEFEKKKALVAEAVPNITSLFKNICSLPLLCTEEILWNFSVEEIREFNRMFPQGV